MRHATYGLVEQQTGARRTGQGLVVQGVVFITSGVSIGLSVCGSRSQAKDHSERTVRSLPDIQGFANRNRALAWPWSAALLNHFSDSVGFTIKTPR